MKKTFIILTALSSLNIYAYDLGVGLPEVEKEKGVSGISVELNYKNINSEKSPVDNIKNIYRLLQNNNDILFETLKNDNLETDYLFKINAGYLNGRDLKSPNVSVVLGTSLDEENRIGMAFTYNDFENKYAGLKYDGKGYHFSLFHSQKEDNKNFQTIAYVGSADEKEKNDEKRDNTYWGVHTRYEHIEEIYNELYKGYRIDIEGKQLRTKEKELKKTNDSVKAGIKGIAKKEIEVANDHKVSIELLAGYEREFMEERIYKDRMKDDFKDSLTIEVKGSYDVAEIITTYVSLQGRKSLNTSNTESMITAGIQYKF